MSSATVVLQGLDLGCFKLGSTKIASVQFLAQSHCPTQKTVTNLYVWGRVVRMQMAGRCFSIVYSSFSHHSASFISSIKV